MEDCTNKRVSIETKLHLSNPTLSHHTSLQYNTSFFSKHPIFKRNKSTEVVLLQNINKEEIFQLVFGFAGKIITNSSYLHAVIKDMKYETEDRHISVAKIQSSQNFSNESISSVTSEEGCSEEEKQNWDTIKEQKDENKLSELEAKIKNQGRQQKVSIMFESFSSFSSDSKLSCGSIVSISSIKFPPHILSLQLIRQIFESPQPFLINLTMCLMIKFIFYSKIEVTCANVCWIMSIGTIIGYKIYYDEPVGGLIESFSQILEMSKSEIMELQRYFLDKIEFQAVITSEQYHIMLSKILKQ